MWFSFSKWQLHNWYYRRSEPNSCLFSSVNPDAVFQIKWIWCNMFKDRPVSFCWSEASAYMCAVANLSKSHTSNGGNYKRCEELCCCRCDHSDVVNLWLKFLQLSLFRFYVSASAGSSCLFLYLFACYSKSGWKLLCGILLCIVDFCLSGIAFLMKCELGKRKRWRM